jgi:hypothetical protein
MRDRLKRAGSVARRVLPLLALVLAAVAASRGQHYPW